MCEQDRRNRLPRMVISTCITAISKSNENTYCCCFSCYVEKAVHNSKLENCYLCISLGRFLWSIFGS